MDNETYTSSTVQSTSGVLHEDYDATVAPKNSRRKKRHDSSKELLSSSSISFEQDSESGSMALNSNVATKSLDSGPMDAFSDSPGKDSLDVQTNFKCLDGEKNNKNEQELKVLRAQVANFKEERLQYEKELQLKCDMALVEAKQAHQRALLNLETELESELRIEITKELSTSAQQSSQMKTLSEELSAKSTALKAALNQISSLNSRNKELMLKNEELSEKSKIMDTQVRQLIDESSELSVLRAKVAELEPKCSSIQSELTDLIAERNSLSEKLEKESLAHLKTRSDLENRLAGASARQNATILEIRRETSAEKSELENKLSVATAELETSRKLFALRTSEYEAQRSKNSEIERELTTVKEELDALRAQSSIDAAEALGHRGALESELELLRTDIREEQRVAQTALKELSAIQVAVNSDTSRSEQLQRQLLETLGELKGFREQNATLELEISRLQTTTTDHSALLKENEEQKIKLNQLRQQRRSLQEELRKLIKSPSSSSLASSSQGALALSTPLTSRGPSMSNIFDAMKGGPNSPIIVESAAVPTSSVSTSAIAAPETVRQKCNDSNRTADVNPASTVLPLSTKSSSQPVALAGALAITIPMAEKSPSELLIQLDYVRQTMRQFLLRPSTRRSLVPVIQTILGCSDDEAKKLNHQFH